MKTRALPFNAMAIELVWTTIAVSVALAVFWHSLDFSLLRLDVPLIYARDPLSYMYTYDMLGRPAMGAPAMTGMPFGSSLYDAPNADAFNLWLIRFLEFTGGGFGTAFNLYLLSTVLLVGVCAYAAGRRLGLSPLWACALSILFNSLPFHIQRIGHLFFLNYAPAAVCAWLALGVVMSAPHREVRWPYGLLILVACLFCGASGIYYAFFSCFFLSLATLLALIQNPNKVTVLRGLVIVVLIALTSAANLLPSLRYQSQHGVNSEVVHRQPGESELYGLKLSQMLLPIEEHHLPAFAELKTRYAEQSPLINENKTAALGIVGGGGFLILLMVPFLGRYRDAFSETVKNAAPLAWIGFLYATVGGLGTLFAWLISPQLHGLNRISVFLGFLALFTFFAAVQQLTSKWRNRFAPLLLCSAIVAFGIFDTSPTVYANAASYPAFQARFDSDQQFGQALEAALPAGSMIFQLPFIEYPEGRPKVGLGSYDLLTPLLQTRTLRWTFGAMKGRPDGQWYKIMASLDMQKLLEGIKAVGFAAIVINRDGYSDRAASTEQLLLDAGLIRETVSKDETQAMYTVPNAAASEQMALAVAPGEGWYPLDIADQKARIWSRGDAEIVLSNVASQRSECTLAMILTAAGARKISLIDGSETIAQIDLKAGMSGSLSGKIKRVPGHEKRLLVRTDAPAQPIAERGSGPVTFLWTVGDDYICR